MHVKSQRLSAVTSPHEAIRGIYPGMLDHGVFARAGITPQDVAYHRLTYDPSFLSDLVGCLPFDMLYLIVGAAVIQHSTSVRPRWLKKAGIANMELGLKGKRKQGLHGFVLAAQYEPVLLKGGRGPRLGTEAMTRTRFFYPGGIALDQHWIGLTVGEEMENYWMK